MPAHSIEVERGSAGASRVRLHGEVDLASADEVRNAITRVGSIADTDVVVDCTGLTFIDSTGIGALLRAQTLLAKGGHRLTLVGVQPFLTRILETLGVDDLLRDGADAAC